MTTGHGHPKGDEPFDPVTDPSYAKDADFEVTETPRGLRLHGDCPRCGHEMSYDYVDDYYKGVFSGGRTSKPLSSGADGEQPLRMLCTCVHKHANRPADEEGCGAYWSVEIARADD